MNVTNQSLIKFGVVVVVSFILGFAVWIILKLRGDVYKINKEDIYEYLRR